MSAFDPTTFMQTAINEPNDTKFESCPPGEFNAVISKIEIKEITSKKSGKLVYPCELTWNVLDEKVKAELGRDNVTVRQSLWIDFTDSGSLDMGKGKNVGLGKLREALGMNGPGFSFAKLEGAGPARISVAERPNEKDPSNPYVNVVAVGKYAV